MGSYVQAGVFGKMGQSDIFVCLDQVTYVSVGMASEIPLPDNSRKRSIHLWQKVLSERRPSDRQEDVH